MTRPDWCPVDVWEAAISVQYQEPGLCLANSQIEPTARAILAEREAILDAAHAYLMQQYGYGMLSHPVDRERIFSIRAGTPCP